MAPASFLRSWIAWVTAGEAAGFAVPAVVGALSAGADTVLAVPGLLLAGAVEGAILGTAQVHVLRKAIPALSSEWWIAATSAAAIVSYTLGILPSTLASSVSGLWLAAIAVACGLLLLLTMGTAQWIVLRHHVARAGRWIAITAVGWLAGLAVFLLIATPLWHQGQQLWLTVAIGVLAGLFMAAAVAVITGFGMRALLNIRA
ncbi:hypothetical protein [Catelliglobosispora koreensis]|uniref:hypothetical protein n=1 Tax=Catelliglobosispora koreensis TaxID=129052 RepID=UPI00037226F7|nr:hypothetical protein [Catelliglobosispora koreensis]